MLCFKKNRNNLRLRLIITSSKEDLLLLLRGLWQSGHLDLIRDWGDLRLIFSLCEASSMHLLSPVLHPTQAFVLSWNWSSGIGIGSLHSWNEAAISRQGIRHGVGEAGMELKKHFSESKYHMLTHIYGILKNGSDEPRGRTGIKTQM